MGWGSKKYSYIFVVVFVFVMLVVRFDGFAYGNGVDGPGNPSAGDPTTCAGFVDGYQLLCGDPLGSDGGGKAWHVYRTTGDNAYAGPVIEYSGWDIVVPDQNGNYVTINDIKNKCNKGNGYDWYAAFGWEGSRSQGRYNILTGPMQDNGIIGAGWYNNYGAWNYDTLIKKIQDGDYPTNQRITSAAAGQLYYLQKGTTTIPTTEGYFCFSLNNFEAQASVAEGTNWTGTSNRAVTGWVTGDKSVSINVECKNDGCNTNFWLQLRSKTSSSSTNYQIGESSNGGNTTWSKQQSTTPGSGGVYLLGESDNIGKKVTLKPGQSICEKLKFYPIGNTAKIVTACAEAKVTTFYSKSSVSGDTSGTTDFLSRTDDPTERVTINDCSPVSGCKVKFTHAMKTNDTGIGSSTYRIERTSNLTDENSGRQIASNSEIKTGTFNGPEKSGKNVNTSSELTMYPGMIVCERIFFKPNNKPATIDDDKTWASTRICVYALGEARDGSSDETYLNIKVRNTDVSGYNEFQSEVYAKPGDNVQYRATYNPVLQYAYYLIPRKMSINGGTIYPTDRLNFDDRLWQMFNASSSLPGWNNAFNIESYNFNLETGGKTKDYSYEVGNMTKRTETNSHKVLTGEVGVKNVGEKAKTNTAESNQTTPEQVKFTYSDSTSIANVLTGSIESKAYVRVPYNFINTTEITTDKNTILYAGESTTIKHKITTNKRRNNVTDGTYATIVKSAKWKVQLYYGGSWHDSTVGGGTLNSSGKMEGDTSNDKNASVVVPDVDAGTRVCMRSAVYPANSGAEKNYENPGGNGEWAYSEEVCFIVAKKPSVQVWGGSVYSNTMLSVPSAVKNHVDGFDSQPYNINGNNSNRVFGSWTELSLVTIKQNTGFGSGASMGYADNNGGVLSPSYNSDNTIGIDPGGSKEGKNTNFCLRSVLTFANTGSNINLTCSGATPGLSASGSDMASNNKLSLIARFVNMTDEEREEKHVEYINNDGNYTIDSMTVNKGVTKVIRASRTATISSDLIYEDGYTTLTDIPKLIIYAENIKINCGVDRIDAVLISENDINTCADSDEVNAEMNSNQLIINGSVITNTLTANRTYGAAKGSNSIIPAEIVNYDATLYLWSSNKADVTESGRLNNVYLRELSPRY